MLGKKKKTILANDFFGFEIKKKKKVLFLFLFSFLVGFTLIKILY